MKKSIPWIITIILLAFINILLPHTDKIATVKTLEQNNYKVILVGGFDFWAGNKSDWYKTKFKALAPNGDTVIGTVTKGLFSNENVIRVKN
jgi:hypothetical protein